MSLTGGWHLARHAFAGPRRLWGCGVGSCRVYDAVERTVMGHFQPIHFMIILAAVLSCPVAVVIVVIALVASKKKRRD